MNINGKLYRELRCRNDQCQKLFGYEYMIVGRIAVFCPRCGELTTLIKKFMPNQYTQNQIEEFTIHSKKNREEVNK